MSSCNKLLAARGCEHGQCAIISLLIEPQELGRRHAVAVTADVCVAALVEWPLVKLLADEHDDAALAVQHRWWRRDGGRELEEGSDHLVVGAACVARWQLSGV